MSNSNSNPEFMIDSFTGKYEFLSNFDRCQVWYDNELYPTVEHAFQAAKTNSLFERNKILNLETPGQAKRGGKAVTLRPDWESVKIDIMYYLLSQKFDKLPWTNDLLDTGSAILVEGNTWGDTYWGVCKGVGKNHLGKLLMQVREDINIARMVEE